MNEYEGRANSVATQCTTGTGEHKSVPAEVKRGTQTPASPGDLTPTPSRPTSPCKVSKSSVRGRSAGANSAGSTTGLTNGASSSNENIDHSEVIDRLHAASAAAEDTKRAVNDSHPPPSPRSSFLSRSLTPKYRSKALPIPDAARGKDMPTPPPVSASGPSGPTPSRRQQQPQQSQSQPQHQQRSLQPYGYYTSPSPSEPGFPQNPPPIPSQGGHQSFAHTQQQTSVQRSAGFVGQYTMSPSPSSIYPQHQVQHQYAYPQLAIPGMPPLPHTHSHTPPEFYSVSHSASPTQPPLYAPAFHTSVPQEHASSPALAFDFDRTGNPGRNPSTGPSSPYTTQQPFASYSLHPTITATPQFTHSHSPFSPPYATQQGRHSHQQYHPPSYAYVTRASPTSPEDTSQPQQQASGTWWFIPPGASPSTGPYPNMYYVDAYGNPSNPGPSPGPVPGLSSLSPPSSTRPVHPPAFSVPDLPASSGPGSGRNSVVGVHQRPPETNKSVSSSSSQIHHSPSPLALGESVSERGQHRQPPEHQQVQSKQSARRSFLPNPPAQRSEWVMWVGNVPSDATHDELWRFFSRATLPRIPSQAEPHPPFQQHHQSQLHLPAGLLSPTGSSSASDASPADTSGVQSVFLIARSNCAFVNYVNEGHLSAAVERFNGVPLRPSDPRCPRLVCRIRGKDEDLRAGVGAQRGTGMHTRWVREQREKAKPQQEKQDASIDGTLTNSEAYASEPPGTPSSVAITESGTESSTQSSGRRQPHHSSSSGSTTSGFLARYFPKRYFILKSLTQYDLDLSVKKGVWATQPHNETVLNQAYRNSSDVYLIFSVNKSGEFYGYARMAGPIGKTAVDRVSWASRSDSQHSQHSHSHADSFASSVAGKGTQETIPEESENNSPEPKEGSFSKGKERETQGDRPVMLFSPSERRLAENSPQPVTPATQRRLSTAQEVGASRVPTSEEAASAPLPKQNPKESALQGGPQLPKPSPPTSAPAVMGPQYYPIASAQVEGLASETLDPRLLRRRLPEVELNPEAPYRAVRNQEPHYRPEESSSKDEERVKRRDTLHRVISDPTSASKLQEAQPDLPNASSAEAIIPGEQTDQSTQWGTPFKIQWIRTQRLPFSRTRHLRNPWNHEREVKVSRDGTELEPGVGQALLDEWDKEDPGAQPPVQPSPGAGAAASGRRGPQNRRTQSSQPAPIPEGEAGPGPDSPRPHQQKQRPR